MEYITSTTRLTFCEPYQFMTTFSTAPDLCVVLWNKQQYFPPGSMENLPLSTILSYMCWLMRGIDFWNIQASLSPFFGWNWAHFPWSLIATICYMPREFSLSTHLQFQDKFMFIPFKFPCCLLLRLCCLFRQGFDAGVVGGCICWFGEHTGGVQLGDLLPILWGYHYCCRIPIFISFGELCMRYLDGGANSDQFIIIIFNWCAGWPAHHFVVGFIQ